MSTLGQRLRGQREERRLSRAKVALATGIRAHQLSSIEHDNFDALPDEAFTSGSVRTYVEYLGLEPEEIVAEILEKLDPGRLPLVIPEAATGEPAGPAKPPEPRAAPSVPAAHPITNKARTGGSSAQPAGQAELPPSIPHTAASAAASPSGRKPILAGSRLAGLIGIFLVVALIAWGLAQWGGGDGAAGEIPFGSSPASNPKTVEEPVTGQERPVATLPPSVRSEAPAGGSDSTPIEIPDSVPANPEPESEPQPGPGIGALSISEYGVGTRIENRSLVGRARRFSVGTKVSFWTRVRGGSPGDRVRHVWLHEGRETDSIELTLGGAHWRTYTRKTLFEASVGAWTVEARDAEGNVLARSEFVCVPAG